ncbi:GNAT family N-acetyltransferase [Streptomyces sp. NPDC057950]|uniref:GNAT family N-acetyltransferase n=1 Tax=Streptomyces sp. NPDC057950 TaxID=3346288 RepID=UPI0036DFB1CE
MGMSVTISGATEQDVEQILKLQYLCYQSEAELSGDYGIEPLTQPLDSLRAELADGTVLVARLGQEVVASVRGTVDPDGTARINKLIVHPRMQRHGIGARLLRAAEAALAGERGAKRIQLHTGQRGGGNLRLYRSVGYETVGTSKGDDGVTVIVLEKPAETYATTA